MCVFQGLDANTVHIRPETDQWLRKMKDDPINPLDYEELKYGWLVWVYSVAEDDGALAMLPPDLAALIQFAADHNCRVVNLDGDGEIIEDFPRYDEEWEKAGA